MNRRQFTALLPALGVGAQALASVRKPNILFIMTDQQFARGLGCLGHPVLKTPNLDRLAKRGMLFERAYCASPACGPSRAATFSGFFPGTLGIRKNHQPIQGNVAILPEVLRQAGYHTAMAGKLHFSPITKDHGFDEKRLHDAGYDTYDPDEPKYSEYVQWLADRKYGGDTSEVIRRFNEDEVCYEEDIFRFIMGSNWRSEEEHSNTWVTNRTLEFLRKPHEKPFFHFTSYFGPHQPMMPPEPWASMYDPDEIELPPEYYTSVEDKPVVRKRIAGGYVKKSVLSERQYREALAGYYGQISMIDRDVGLILDELKAQGLDKNTMVVFTSDHGDHTGQFGLFFKATAFENAIRIPLVIADPARASSAGKRCRRNVNSIDLYATLREQAGLPAGQTHARSLLPLLADPGFPEWKNETYSEFKAWSTAIKDDWKLIRYRDEDDGVMHELYRTDSDVPDAVNLWDTPSTVAIRSELLKLLDRNEKMSGRL